MRFLIEDKHGRALHVEASDWMMAMVRATAALGAAPTGFDCEHQGGNRVRVTDPRSGEWWQIREDPDPEATLDIPDQAPAVEPVSGGNPVMPPRPRRYRTGVRKPLWAPATASSEAPPGPPPGAPPNLDEQLAEVASGIQGAPDVVAAATRTLQYAMGLTGVEAGSVLTAHDDEGFAFLVVEGGAGPSLVGRRVPFGSGIVGAAFDAGVTIRVEDVSADPRHLQEIDQATGFVTRSLLCVPIRSEAGFHGALELLNATPGSLLPWHVDAVEQLAATLGEVLAQ